MRPAVLLIIAALFFGKNLAAQTACPAGPYPPANTCAAACVLCGSLNGLQSATAMIGQGQIVPGFCTQVVHSMKYVAFIAGSASLSLDVTVGPCTLGNGIEMGIYDSPNCQSFNLISNCNTMMQTGGTYSFSTDEPMNPGCHYYLIFDNNGPAACQFTVNVTSGSTGTPDLPMPPLPDGPGQFCPGASLVYSIPSQPFACEYEWTAPPGATINGLPSPQTLDHDGGNSVTIKFGNSGGNVCVRAKNACKTSPWACRVVTLKTVPLTVLPPATVCQGQGYEWLDGNIYSMPQLLTFTYQTPEGCDSVINQQLKVASPKVTNLGPHYICPGECVTVAGVVACQQGLYDTLYQTFQGCDSLVKFGVIVIPAKAKIAPPGDTLDCLTTQILLDGHGSVGDVWKWFGPGPGGLPIGSDTTQAVGQPGLFKLVLETTAFGKTCRDTAQRVVHQSISPPTTSVSDETITCTHPLAQLSATAQPPSVLFDWQGPGGFSSNLQNPQTGQPGPYFLKTTDPTNGCTDLDSLDIVADLWVPLIEVDTPWITCAQPVATITAGPLVAGQQFTYQWFENGLPVGSGPTFQTGHPGPFDVVATHPTNGCTSELSTQVYKDTAVPVFSTGNATLTCAQPTATLFAQSQDPSLTFQWLENQTVVATGASFTTGSPGSFQVVATDPVNGCTAAATATVFEQKAAPVFSVKGDTITCNSPVAQLSAFCQNPAVTFQWLENQTVVATGPSFSTTNQGVFTVVATDPANGCTAAQTVTAHADAGIPQLALTAAPDTLTCLKTSTQIGVAASPAGLVFAWQSANGQGIAGPTDGQNLTVNGPGQFTLTVVNPANQCTASLAVPVFENKKLPVADAGKPNLLTCFLTETILGNSSLNPTGLSFSWTGPAITPANSALQSPKIDQPGTYFLTVTDMASGCTAIDSIEIQQDIEPPVVTITPPEPLTCTDPQVKIHATCTAFSGFVSWQWLATNGGSIVSGSSSSSCTANVLGEYTAFAFNVNNGCFDSASVFLPEFTDLPEIDAGPPQVLNCKNPTIALLGSGDAGPHFTQLWTTPSGQILSGADGFSPIVSSAGLYFFEIVDTTNGCISTDYVAVTEDFATPTADAGPAKTLNCGTASLALEGSVSTGAEALWTTTGGHFIDPPSTLSPKIDAPGQYFLTATNPANGCTARDSVLVSPDASVPVVAIAPPGLFSCKNKEIMLSATATGASANPILTQNWATAGGQILSGANTLAPKIAKPGGYSITVTDQSNGCSATAQVTVAGDFEPPVIDYVLPEQLSCDVKEVTISTSITSAGGDHVFEWLPQPGNVFVSGQGSLTPVVAAPGSYLLAATDQSNGCADSLFVPIGEKTMSQHLVAIFPAPALDCDHLTVALDAALSFSGPGFALLWKTDTGLIVSDGTTLDPVVGAGGTYTLIIKDLYSGCLDSVSAFVKENLQKPVLSIQPPELLNCKKTSVALTGSGAGQGALSVKWTTAGGQFSGATDQFSSTATAPGLYFLEAKDPVNGCTNRDTVEVLKDDKPPVFSVKTDSITCLNAVAKLEAIGQSPGYSYLWAEVLPGTSPLPVGSSAFFETAAPGVFMATATDPANGCTATDTALVVKKPVITGLSLDLDVPLCFDDGGATLTVTGAAGAEPPVAYSIDNQPFGPKNEWPGLPSGSYFLKVKDAVGCEFDTAVQFSTPLDWQVSLGPDTTIVIGEKILLAMAASPADVFLQEITWDPAVLVGCDTCRSQLVAPKRDRWFGITAVDAFGCTRTDSVLVKVLYPEIFVPNVFTPNGDGENELFRVFCGPGVSKISRFAVYDRWGDALHSEKDLLPDDPAHGWDGLFRGKKVANGVYVWLLEVELASGQKRLLKGDVTVAR